MTTTTDPTTIDPHDPRECETPGCPRVATMRLPAGEWLCERHGQVAPITLTPYVQAATGKDAFKADTQLGKYSVQNHGDHWAAVQLFGMVGLIGGRGSTPLEAVEAALAAGPNPVHVISAS